MATTETELGTSDASPPAAAPTVKVTSKKSDSALDKVLRVLSSVKFGLWMLGTLLLCCMIGMLVMQVNVDGFDRYYANLKPAQKLVYGWLGFFDIYRSRYFTLLLAILGGIRHAPQAVPWLVGLAITAAYWFTSSTSFANPAVTLARGFTTTFSGIALNHVPAFVAAQLVGAAMAALAALVLFPAQKR